MKKPRVLVSSFSCDAHGKSETYSGYKWVEQIARYCDTTLVTAAENGSLGKWQRIQTCRFFQTENKLLRRLNGEMFFDYFWFNYQNKRQLKRSIAQYDLLHHVVPIAPRYPNSLGCVAQKFILGPIGGGLRAPESFRAEVEGNEEWFFKLRALDRIRFDYDPFLRRTYDAADLILLVASYMYDVIPPRYHDKCKVMLETGIDAGEYNSTRPLTANKNEPLKLLYASRIVPYKGLIYALKALDRLPADAKSKIQFTIIGARGEAGYEQVCKDFVRTHGLERVVTFLSFMPKQEILDHYDKNDLFVFPSLAENSGNVILEAMAMGRPVLAVRRGGPAEIVDSESGFLIEPRNPEYLIDQIKEVLLQVLANRELIVAKGTGARKVIENRFGWPKKGEILMKSYEQVLGNGFVFNGEP